MAKGVFTPTNLVEVQAKIEQVWNEPQFSKFYTAHGESAKAVLENQTAVFPELKDPSKEREVAVKWGDFCDDTATTVTNVDSCDITGCDEVDPKTLTYENNTFLEDCFTITDEDYQTSVLDRDRTVALGMLSKIKNITELLNVKVIAMIDANKGVNPFPDEYVVVDNDTQVMKQDFTIENMYPYWMQMQALLRSTNSYVLDGHNLFRAKMLAEGNKANADGKLDQFLFDMFPYYNDILGFTKAGVPNNTYLIDKGAVALQSRQKYPKVPKVWQDYTKYSIPLPGYPGLGLDVMYQQTCVGGSEVHSWKLKFRGLIAVNPFRCDEGNTGIQSFESVPNV